MAYEPLLSHHQQTNPNSNESAENFHPLLIYFRLKENDYRIFIVVVTNFLHESAVKDI